jgi:hypothetical protein
MHRGFGIRQLRHLRPSPLCPLYVEAVRKGDVQESMRERPGSAVEFAGGLDFRTERGSGGPHRLDERLHPEGGDHPLQIVGENVKAHLRADLFEGAQLEVGRAHPRLDGSEWMFRGLASDAHGLGRTV